MIGCAVYVSTLGRYSVEYTIDQRHDVQFVAQDILIGRVHTNKDKKQDEIKWIIQGKPHLWPFERTPDTRRWHDND